MTVMAAVRGGYARPALSAPTSGTNWTTEIPSRLRAERASWLALLSPASWLLDGTQDADSLILSDRPPLEVMEPISAFYDVACDSDLQRALLAWPSVARMCIQAYPHLRRAFGEAAAFGLGLHRDPELPKDESIVVTVRTALPPEDALARLNAFYDEWWLGEMRRCGGSLVFNVELA